MIQEQDWYSTQNILLLNPRLAADAREHFESLFQKIENEYPQASLFCLATSGTTSAGIHSLKLVAIRKQAVLDAADRVNRLLEVNEKSIWLKSIPEFHIGGLSILARSVHSKCKLIDETETGWNPENFCKTLESKTIHFCSLVPAQIFDVVKLGLQSPSTLRLVLVGAGELSEEIESAARKLGWPLLLTFGMTETSAMIATGSRVQGEIEFTPLPSIGIRSHHGKLVVSSSSLLEFYVDSVNSKITIHDPKQNGEYIAEDFIQLLPNNRFKLIGRGQDFVKILGESVNLQELRRKMNSVLIAKGMKPDSIAVIAEADLRTGSRLIAISENQNVTSIIAQFNLEVSPFERIIETRFIHCLPRTTLGKIKYGEFK